MKNILTIILGFTFLFFSMNVNAQSKQEIQLNNAVEKLLAAMISGDRSKLEMLTSNDLSYGHSGGHIEDKSAFVEKITSGKSDFVTIDIADQIISIKGKIAIVRHLFSATTNDNGKPGNVKLKILLVFLKEQGQWKLLARQAVKA